MTMGLEYNQFEQLPYLGYNIISYLFRNEMIWKLLKYDDYDCLEKPNLTDDEKSQMVWRNQDNQSDYNVFLTKLELDSVGDTRTILKIYDYSITPENRLLATICTKFDVVTIGKAHLVDYNGVPVNRVTLIKQQIIKTLNGADVNGVGEMAFDTMLSRWCTSTLDLSNNKNAYGDSFVLACKMGTLGVNEYGED